MPIEPFSWTCPYCNHAAVVSQYNYTQSQTPIRDNGKNGNLILQFQSITCPRKECAEYEIKAFLYLESEECEIFGSPLATWQLRPVSLAKVFPDYIPPALREDYREACQILTSSPKAAATLARRCLQGMIRDFWEIKETNLSKAISLIKEKIEPDVWDAIDAVRKVGNIGAHMEKDINQIVEVDPSEAQMLIHLIELLFKEWYVARNDRATRLSAIVEMAKSKK